MSIMKNGHICLTGNPFVDTGLATIAAFAGLDDVQDLTVTAIRSVHGDGNQLSSWNSSLKNFTMVFTNNSLLTNPSIKDRGKRVSTYRSILSNLRQIALGMYLLGQHFKCGGSQTLGHLPNVRLRKFQILP